MSNTPQNLRRPDTSDTVSYTDEELVFIRATIRWREKHRRIPTACDYLRIAKELGYRKQSDTNAS